MVYCGKPSGGCHACRERKTRCDQRPKPQGCTQCERTKRECPGYRLPGDVIFRNESENVKRKHKAKQARVVAQRKTPDVPTPALVSDIATPESDNPQTPETEESFEVVRQYPPLTQDFLLTPNLEDNAAAFFVNNYVIDCQGPVRGHLDFVTSIYGSEDDMSMSPLVAAMKAVGLAGVSHATKSPVLLKNSRFLYMKAIQSTNAALMSPTSAIKDSTLSAIMILSIYETVTGCNQKSIKDWAAHVEGAAALLKLRGREQLKTTRGRRMFLQITSSLMISCIQRDAPLPDFIIEWSAEFSKDQTPDTEPTYLSQQAMLAFTQFRAAHAKKEISDPEEILSKALELDGVFVELFSTKIPPRWAYRTVYTDQDPDLVWNGSYHVYYDHWISQVWNGMRTARIMLNSVIRATLLAGFSSVPPRFTSPEHTAQFQLSTDVLFKMQADILASVPQHLGYKPASLSTDIDQSFPFRMPGTRSLSGDEHGDMFPIVRMSGPYFLLWPLWFAGFLEIATEELKTYVVHNLRIMGEKMGIRQAIVLADIIRKRETDLVIFSSKR